MVNKSDDKYSDEIAKERMRAALLGSRIAGPMPMKPKAKKSKKSKKKLKLKKRPGK
jgi:hypothetical protein